MEFKSFTQALSKEGIEGELPKSLFIAILTGIVITGILSTLYILDRSAFLEKYGLYLFLSIISFALLVVSLKHVQSYKAFPCMSGMMIGMTIGMIAGFLPGFLIGATNGMFWGSVFGMTIGIVFGVWNGKCCGIMGIMEGIMAGFMGGLMGAMTAIMMFNDNLQVAAYIVFGISAIIILGLHILIHTEGKALEKKEMMKSEWMTIALSSVLSAIAFWMMVFGPRSVLFQ